MKFRIGVYGEKAAISGREAVDETYIVAGEIQEDAENVAIAAFLQEYGDYRDLVDIIAVEEIEE